MVIELMLYAVIAFLAGLLVFWTGQLILPTLRQRLPFLRTPSAAAPTTKTPITAGQRFVVRALIVIMLAMGALAWSFVYTARQDRNKTNGWSSVSGLITTFDSQERIDDTNMSLVGDVTATVKEVVIVYTYQVGDQVYTNDKIYSDERLPAGRRLMEPEDADALAEKYKLGRPVTVYYDPDDPRHAALQQDENRGLYLVGLNAGIAFYFLAGAITRWLVTQR